MRNSPKREQVLALFGEGVDAIESLVSHFEPDPADRAWHRTVTEDWSVEELGRHLLAVADWYHEWLDRAEHGDGAQPFSSRQLADRNELEVHDRRMVSGPDSYRQFTDRSREYLRRLTSAAESDAWNVPYGFAYGTTTVGLHAGAAAAEWHLHAWDLSGGEWQPADPGALYMAAGEVMTSTQPVLQRMVTRRIVPLIAKRDPWNDLLTRTGRKPTRS